MTNNKIQIAIFKPYNARTTNAFYSGEHPIFKYLQENYNYEITYFIDDKNVKFDKIGIKYIKEDKIKTFILRVARKIFGRFKHYWKIPYYKNLDFSKYDIIITEGIHYLLLDYFRRIGSKVILSDSISRDYILSNVQKKYLNKYFNKSLAVVVNNKIPILYKKNDLNIQTFVIGHAVNTNLIPFIKRKKREGSLLSVGRLVPEKGFEYIIKTMALLRRKYPSIKLDIYGDGPQKKELQDLIKSLGIEDIVFLKGFLEYEKMLLNFKHYDLFISHPLETPRIAEAFLMANMEAMASGLPVITSDCGGVPYIVKETAVVVQQKNINKIVNAVEDFMNNSQKVEQYSVNGRNYIEKNFSVEVIAKNWHNIIKNFNNL